MADTSGAAGSVQVIGARKSDIKSLTTIVPRAFHPINPYVKKALPDTPLLRAYWAHIFKEEIDDISCHPLIAADPTTDEVIGVLTLRLCGPDYHGSGFWTDYAWTSDHDAEMWRPAIDGMVEYIEKLMRGRSFYLLELFGADYAYKGKGVGSKLLQKACDIADAAGLEIFVQANGSAKGFYQKFGFRLEAEKIMPGDIEYAEYMMIRQSK